MGFRRKKKEKEKKKERKRKRKNKKELKLQCFALKTEDGPKSIWQKPLKPGALNLYRLRATDLVLSTWVDRWS